MSIPINVFIIYAREDMEIKQRLLRHLNPFKNAFNAVIWHDENIEAGQEWKPHIEVKLEQTDLFVLLISIDFMNSEFINQVEFKYAIDRHKAMKSMVIPVIINYCQWDVDVHFKEYIFNLNELQLLPNEGKPIDDWKTPEKAYDNIAAGIRAVLSTIKRKREQKLPDKEKLELKKVRNEIPKKLKQANIKQKEREVIDQKKVDKERSDSMNAEIDREKQLKQRKKEREAQKIRLEREEAERELEKRKNTRFAVGDLFLGKIKQIIPGLNAAFVDIGSEHLAFIHYIDLGTYAKSLLRFINMCAEDKRKWEADFSRFIIEPELDKKGKIGHLLAVNQTILVQIITEPVAAKGPRLSCEILLSGRLVGLIPFNNTITVSKKINSSREKERLKLVVEGIKPKNCGVIVRPSAAGRNVEELNEDFSTLMVMWQKIQDNLKRMEAPAKVFGDEIGITSIVRLQL